MSKRVNYVKIKSKEQISSLFISLCFNCLLLDIITCRHRWSRSTYILLRNFIFARISISYAIDVLSIFNLAINHFHWSVSEKASSSLNYFHMILMSFNTLLSFSFKLNLSNLYFIAYTWINKLMQKRTTRIKFYFTKHR